MHSGLKMQIRGGVETKTASMMTDFRDETIPTCTNSDGDPEPLDKRNGGCAAVVGNKLYVWGGQTEDLVSWSCPYIFLE